jgi:hypothetical protein
VVLKARDRYLGVLPHAESRAAHRCSSIDPGIGTLRRAEEKKAWAKEDNRRQLSMVYPELHYGTVGPQYMQQSGAFGQAQALWHKQTFCQLKYALHQECKQRCWNGSLHDQRNIIKSDTGEYRLSVAAGSYQSA